MDSSLLQKAVTLLRDGEVVGLPTETVYGLAGDASNTAALARIFAIKERPEFDPLIVHAANLERAMEVVKDFPAEARRLARWFWPGPLTLVLSKAPWVPDLATAGLETVAVRVPAHPVAQAVLEGFGGFLAAPSANKFGGISPTTAAAVRTELGDRVPLVLDGGACPRGVESTIISFADGRPVCLRLGATALEDVEKIVGPVEVCRRRDPRLAPGAFGRHYAPRTPLAIWNGEQDAPAAGVRAVFMGFNRERVPGPWPVRWLSETGNLEEAAANFFQTLRELDAVGADLILAEAFPERGVGRALNERLRRAAAGVQGQGGGCDG